MARGWESKAVEDQINSAREREETKAPVPEATRAARSERAVLLLSKQKVLADLDRARDDRHRASLTQALEYLDSALEALEDTIRKQR